MTYKPLTLGLAGLIALALLAFGGTDGIKASHNTTGPASLAIDAITTGNTATALGVRDNCVEVTAGNDAVVDVTVDTIPTANKMIGFNFNMTYDPAALSVSAASATNQLIGSAPGSLAGTAGDEAVVPDMDGAFLAVGYDVGPVGPSSESGSGVLERLTITVDPGAANGGYNLNLYDTILSDTANVPRLPVALYSARLAVGVTCASLGTTPPAPNPTIIGDVDCNGANPGPVDALKILRTTTNLTVTQTAPCTYIGISTQANASAPAPIHVGDVDCSGSVTPADALKVLRKSAALSVTQTEPCDDLGT
jgi:hypothetical protein